MELFVPLAPFELLFLAYAIIYGIAYGLSNSINRFISLFTGRNLKQGVTGRFLDGTFWFSLIVLVVLNKK
jgi:hypothetical protein